MSENARFGAWHDGYRLYPNKARKGSSKRIGIVYIYDRSRRIENAFDSDEPAFAEIPSSEGIFAIVLTCLLSARDYVK